PPFRLGTLHGLFRRFTLVRFLALVPLRGLVGLPRLFRFRVLAGSVGLGFSFLLATRPGILFGVVGQVPAGAFQLKRWRRDELLHRSAALWTHVHRRIRKFP